MVEETEEGEIRYPLIVRHYGESVSAHIVQLLEQLVAELEGAKQAGE